VRIAYLQDKRQLARLTISPGEFGIVQPEQRLPFTLYVGNPNKQVASVNGSHFRWGCESTVIVIFLEGNCNSWNKY